MIRPLEVLSFGTRVILTFVIILIVLLALSVIGYLSGGWEAQGAPEPSVVSKYEGHLVEIDRRALDLAYQDHLKLLFSVWLKDDVAAEQRIRNGLRIARRAYASAAEQIEQREQALQK
jgi:hypothetical protein